MSDQPGLLIRHKDDRLIALAEWRRAAAECGAEIDDSYESTNPFTQQPTSLSLPGCGRWEREDGVLHLKYQERSIHIRPPRSVDDPELNRLASLLGAELVVEDPFDEFLKNLRRERKK